MGRLEWEKRKRKKQLDLWSQMSPSLQSLGPTFTGIGVRLKLQLEKSSNKPRHVQMDMFGVDEFVTLKIRYHEILDHLEP